MLTGDLRILSWVRCNSSERDTGLGGYLSLAYGDLVLDGITVRRTAEDGFTLSFPARTDRAGRRHPYIRPVDDEARRRIEAEVVKQLGDMEVSNASR